MRPATPIGPRLEGVTSIGVGISHSAPDLVAPRILPSRANCRTRRSETPKQAAACSTLGDCARADWGVIEARPLDAGYGAGFA